MQQSGRDENGGEQVRTIAEGAELAAVRTPDTQKRRRKVVGCLLQGGEALLVLAVGVYLPLKVRGVLETPEAGARMKKKKALRSFPTQGGFLNVSKHD